MNQPTHGGLARRLTNQAAGDRQAEAAARILTLAVDGRLVGSLAPAIDDQPAEAMAFINWDVALQVTRNLSNGEQSLVRLAASLATSRMVNLAEALTGLDRGNALVVLDAFAHALSLDQADEVGQ